jgi:hypothetical protein
MRVISPRQSKSSQKKGGLNLRPPIYLLFAVDAYRAARLLFQLPPRGAGEERFGHVGSTTTFG